MSSSVKAPSPGLSDLPDQPELLHRIIENIPDMIFLKSAEDLRFVLFNRAGEELLGYSRHELIGKNDFDFFPEEQARFFTEKDRQILCSPGILDIPEERILTRHKGERILHTKKMAVRDAYGRPLYLLGISEDITDLKQQQQMVIHSGRLSNLGEMAGGIAHEINNPLAIIKGFAQEIERAVGRDRLDPDRLLHIARRITATTERIARVVKALRTFAREVEEDPKVPVPVRSLVNDALDLCGERFRNHGIRIEVADIPERLQVPCRPVQISQALINLLSNAFDAVERLPDAWVRIEVVETPETVALAVTDSGPGIPAAHRDRLFIPFFTTKEMGRGTGLGLSISKGLVDSHGGTLRYDAASPNTRFLLELPRA